MARRDVSETRDVPACEAAALLVAAVATTLIVEQRGLGRRTGDLNSSPLRLSVGLGNKEMGMKVLIKCIAPVACLMPGIAAAAENMRQAPRSVGNVGVSGLWVLANICFAGMRAQNSSSTGWRVVAFIFGFPGTLITYFVVKEGSERAYGIELPRKR